MPSPSRVAALQAPILGKALLVAAMLASAARPGPVQAAALRQPAYAVVSAASMPDRITMVRFDSLSACLRELPKLKQLVAEVLRGTARKDPGLITPHEVSEERGSLPTIEGSCRALPGS